MRARHHFRHGRAWTLPTLAAGAALLWLLVAPAASPGAGTAAPDVQARSGIMISRTTGDVLWAKQPGLRLPPASCTKIMTALLVLEHYGDLDRYLRAPASVTGQQIVAIGLRPGDRITVRQALRAMLVKSANDATVTLAAGVAGSERAFVKKMNLRASQLGLTHTHYVNSRGKDATGHYMSARDLAKLSLYVWNKYPFFRETVGTKTAVISWPPSHKVTVTSHNRILDQPWGDGIKTGATAKAGKVLVGSGTPSGRTSAGVPLIVVTMHEPSRDQEEKDAVALFLWGAAQ
jgi:serine-type D-Ala-D-Ala carboxypeptidase (penicillin-binding protein 5/6)